MSQGESSVSEFVVDFYIAAGERRWNATVLYDAFHRGLTPKVKDVLATHELPTKLDDLIFLAT